MIKPVLFASLFSMVSVGPALADPSTYHLDLKLDSGRHYALVVMLDRCGSAFARAPSVEDDIKVCTRTPKNGGGVTLDIEWKNRQGDRELHLSSSGNVTRGSFVTLDADTAKLTVSLQ